MEPVRAVILRVALTVAALTDAANGQQPANAECALAGCSSLWLLSRGELLDQVLNVVCVDQHQIAFVVTD